ncbi:MAG: hypothetical protein ACYDA0_14540 [Candidatus Dormibacteraceae bacterium]
MAILDAQLMVAGSDPVENRTGFTYAVDVLDEGAEAVVANLRERAGLTGVAVAASYHAARDLLPHNPRRVIAYQESGVVYFPPDVSLYGHTSLKPQVARAAGGRDVLVELRAAADEAFDVAAWTVFLHNSRLGQEHETSCCRNVFDEALTHILCPSNTEVAAYCEALATDVASRRPATLYLESATFMPFDHGGHHERAFISLPQGARFLLGLCFCDSCARRTEDAGVDFVSVRKWVADRLHGFLADANDPFPAGDSLEWMRLAEHGLLARFFDVRRGTVVELVRRLVHAIKSHSPDTRVVLLDVSGAFAGSTQSSALDFAWRDGVPVADAVTAGLDGLAVCGYFADGTRLADEVAQYRHLLPPEVRLEVILRPGWPDSSTPEELRQRVAAVRAAGAADLAFYNYGSVRLQSLDWIRLAAGG